MPRIDAFLKLGREQDCSDIHLTVGMPPLVRLDGELIALKYRELTREETGSIIDEVLDPRQMKDLEEKGAVDFSYAAEGVGRFRINVVHQLRGTSAVCRVIPTKVPTLDQLGLPAEIPRFTEVKSGLILVTGTAGTGKSTTLAAMIHEINRTRHLNIITLEDPVEFIHEDQKSMVTQRELGGHLVSFSDGLRAALRQDPDVILVGELRDPDSIALAIEAAETGHLVLGTLHTRGAYQTIHRIVDAFPADAQEQIRHTLADSLKCVISQDLLRLADGRGRRLATEILVMTQAIAQLIREGKTFQIPQAIATGKRYGMNSMDQSLLGLVRAGVIDPDEAYLHATDKREFVAHVTNPQLLEMMDAAPRRSSAA